MRIYVGTYKLPVIILVNVFLFLEIPKATNKHAHPIKIDFHSKVPTIFNSYWHTRCRGMKKKCLQKSAEQILGISR